MRAIGNRYVPVPQASMDADSGLLGDTHRKLQTQGLREAYPLSEERLFI